MVDIHLGPYEDTPGYSAALARDERDPIAEFRTKFVARNPDLIYLDGNSLGRMPVATPAAISEVLSNEWGDRLVASWGERWWPLAREVGAKIAPLIGADPASVIVADSTSVALFKLALAALRNRPERRKVVTDDLNFPSDVYVLGAAAEAAGGRELNIVESADGIYGPEDELLASLDENTALISLSHVAFKSGYLYNIERITRAAHDAGALVLWDLSHSVGVVPMDLSEADLAVGCTYKYLNGGPGAPSFLYVNPRLTVENPVAGWWGHTDPFSFDLEFKPQTSIARFQTGTMPILSLAAIEPAVDLVARAGVEALRAKSIALTELLVDLSDEYLVPLGFTVASPRESQLRGSHVALKHPEAWQLAQAMIDEAKVVPDFREPDNLRLGIAPIYTGFVDVHTAVQRIVSLMRSGAIARYSGKRRFIT